MSYLKLPDINCFPDFFPCKHWIPLHQSFIPTNLVPISLFAPQVFFSSYLWLFRLSRGAWILFYTPLWLHLHRSGNKKWVWRMCPDPAGLQTTETWVMIPQLGAAGLGGGRVPVCTDAWATFLVRTDPAEARHCQGKWVCREHLIFNATVTQYRLDKYFKMFWKQMLGSSFLSVLPSWSHNALTITTLYTLKAGGYEDFQL